MDPIGKTSTVQVKIRIPVALNQQLVSFKMQGGASRSRIISALLTLFLEGDLAISDTAINLSTPLPPEVEVLEGLMQYLSECSGQERPLPPEPFVDPAALVYAYEGDGLDAGMGSTMEAD